MGTRSTAFQSYSHTGGVIFLSLWVTTIVISRVYMFYNALNAEWSLRDNNAWLLEKCSEPEFFFKLKEHTDICHEVERLNRSNAYLNALYIVVNGSHLCGESPCIDTVQSVVAKLGWQALVILVLCILFSPNLIYYFHRRHNLNKQSPMESVCFQDTMPYRRYEILDDETSQLRQRYKP
jgi:hypothetical protein